MFLGEHIARHHIRKTVWNTASNPARKMIPLMIERRLLEETSHRSMCLVSKHAWDIANNAASRGNIEATAAALLFVGKRAEKKQAEVLATAYANGEVYLAAYPEYHLEETERIRFLSERQGKEQRLLRLSEKLRR